MVRQQLLLVVGALSVAACVLLPSRASVADTSDCSSTAVLIGGCDDPGPSTSGSINGNGVDVGVTQERGGSGRSDSGGGVGVDDASGDAVPAFDPRVLRMTPACVPGQPCAPTTPGLRLSDLISFHPPAPTTKMEPNGWAVVNLDANFIAHAGVDVQSGTLLGAPAQVRFTPGRFSWDYGDGATRTSRGGGSTWKQLGVPEFSPTPTSHVFRQVATFTIHVSVAYTAEYRFANQGWESIAGSLEIPASEFEVVVGQAKTVLVGRDCAANPFGPGC